MENRSVTVWAAGSLRGLMPGLMTDFERKNGWSTVLRMGPALRLGHELEAGAAVDLFVSSDVAHARKLAALRPGARCTPWIATSLSLLFPSEGPVAEELAKGGPDAWRRALELPGLAVGISNPEADPAGRYAQAFLEREGIRPSEVRPLVGGCAHQVRADQKDASWLFSQWGCGVFVGYAHYARAAVESDASLAMLTLPGPACRFAAAVFTKLGQEVFDRLQSPEALAACAQAGFLPPEA